MGEEPYVESLKKLKNAVDESFSNAIIINNHDESKAMPQIKTDAITLEYDTFGSKTDPPMILIMGLTAQMINWPDGFCEQLAEAGHFVIRFDNRDCGLSTKFETLDVPNINQVEARLKRGEPFLPPYTLSEMASDVLVLMEGLNIEVAHVCGMSMGGMMAQILALEYPEKVLSVTSMASTTSEPDLPKPTPEATKALVSLPPVQREANIDHSLWIQRVFSNGSTYWDEALQKEIIAKCYDRAFYPLGFARQMTAIMMAPGRRKALQNLQRPLLVIHGEIDPLTTLPHGEDTAQSAPQGRLVVLPEWGHGMAYPYYWPQMVAKIAEHTLKAD